MGRYVHYSEHIGRGCRLNSQYPMGPAGMMCEDDHPSAMSHLEGGFNERLHTYAIEEGNEAIVGS